MQPTTVTERMVSTHLRPPRAAHEVHPHAPSRIRRLQVESGGEPCFRSDQRYTCRDFTCRFAAECRRRMVAAWRR